MIWLRRLSLLFLLLLLLLAAVAAYVTMTHGGMQRIFSLGKSYAQGELTWRDSTGKLIGPATITDLDYIGNDGLSVSVANAGFDWQPKKLLSGTLQVDELSVSGIEIRLPPPAAETPQATAEPFQLQDLALPVGVDIKKLSITDIAVYPHEAIEPIIIDEVLLSAGGRDDKLKLVEFTVRAPEGQLRMEGSVDTSSQWPLAIQQQWQYSHAGYGDFTGEGSITGNIETLQVTHQVSGNATLELNAVISDVTKALNWQATVTTGADDLGAFSEAMTGVPFNLNARSSGSLENYTATGEFDTDHPQTGAVSGTFTVDGSPQSLKIEAAEIALTETTLVASLDGEVALADLQSDVTLRWRDLVLPLRGEPAVAQSPSGKLHFTGTPQNYKVSSNAELLQDQTGALQLTLLAGGTPDKLSVESLSLDSVDGDTKLTGTALVDLKNQTVDATGNWQQLTWPLIGEPLLIDSPAGQFAVKGPVTGYTLSTTIELDATSIPAGSWQLSANGNAESLSDIKLNGSTLDGVIEANGTATWTPETEFNLTLQGRDVNPASQWPGLDGRIGFQSTVQGRVGDNGPDIKATIDELSGDYRKQALSGRAEVTIANGDLAIDALDIKAGSTKINGTGTVGEALDLQWQLDAPALARLHPSLAGAIKTRGKLTGSADAPVADFTIDLKNYTSTALVVRNLTGAGVVDLSGDSRSNIKLTASDIVVSDRRIDQLTLQGRGKPAKHSMDLTLQGDDADLAVSAAGGLVDGQWQGLVRQLDIKKTLLGDWGLQQPMSISAGSESAQADTFCLQSDDTTLCGDGRWSAANGVTARLSLDEFSAQRFDEFLPPDIGIDAALNGTVNISVGAGGNVKAVADFAIPGGGIAYENAGELVETALGASVIKAEFSNDNVVSDVRLNLGEIGTVNMDATIAGVSGRQRMSGSVNTDLRDISLLGIAMPQLQSIDGQLQTNLKLGGTVAAPVVTGEARVEGFAAEVPSVALKIVDGVLTAVSDNKGGLRIDGSARSGDGNLDLNGMFNPGSGKLELNLQGDQFQVANTNRQKAVISPDIQLRMDSSDISVTGTLEIPSAFIKAGGEGSTLRESPDVVIIDSSGAVPEQPAASQVRLNVEVKLGDDIRVKAGQFDGALSGGLTIEQLPGRAPTGSGAIDVVNGDFLVYGQKLTMERGRILFSGGPVDNPALELDVARDVQEYGVKAGASIRGTAQDPLLELTSDPQQTDANTLSYILLGKPLGTLGASYTLGRFITPDIYVSYGIDLFDKIETFNLKYKITDRLSLIASSSEKNSADLIYTIER